MYSANCQPDCPACLPQVDSVLASRHTSPKEAEQAPKAEEPYLVLASALARSLRYATDTGLAFFSPPTHNTLVLANISCLFYSRLRYFIA